MRAKKPEKIGKEKMPSVETVCVGLMIGGSIPQDDFEDAQNMIYGDDDFDIEDDDDFDDDWDDDDYDWDTDDPWGDADDPDY